MSVFCLSHFLAAILSTAKARTGHEFSIEQEGFSEKVEVFIRGEDNYPNDGFLQRVCDTLNMGICQQLKGKSWHAQ